MSKTINVGPVTAYGIALKYGYQGTEQEWIQAVGGDLSNYYPKSTIDEMFETQIPDRLPNPSALTINGTSYDGSAPVSLAIESVAAPNTVNGKFIHIEDAIPSPLLSLELYNSSGASVSGNVTITNKNLFRIDLIEPTWTDKGITFEKQSNGGIYATGTSTGAYPATQCSIDKNAFAVGQKYTLSSGKTSGNLYVQLAITYTDNTVDYIAARNVANTFTISKAVSSVTGSVQITDTNVTVDETVYPQLEASSTASAFAMNVYNSVAYTGATLPVLPAQISNVWSNTDTVTDISLSYDSDVLPKVLADITALQTEVSSKIGDTSLAELTTTDKTLVGAINEVNGKSPTTEGGTKVEVDEPNETLRITVKGVTTNG